MTGQAHRLWCASAHRWRTVAGLVGATTRRASEALSETLGHECVDDRVDAAVEVRHQRERLSMWTTSTYKYNRLHFVCGSACVYAYMHLFMLGYR